VLEASQVLMLELEGDAVVVAAETPLAFFDR
jgi:hypothetical protein